MRASNCRTILAEATNSLEDTCVEWAPLDFTVSPLPTDKVGVVLASVVPVRIFVFLQPLPAELRRTALAGRLRSPSEDSRSSDTPSATIEGFDNIPKSLQPGSPHPGQT